MEVRGDRVDLLGRELLGVGAHEPRDPRPRAVDARGPAVRGRARVGLRGEVPEDQVHVAADREQLGRDRAPPPAHRHASGDRGEVRPQRAGVDELAREQPVEVGAPGGRDPPGSDRDDVGRRAADVEHQRVGVPRGDRERARRPVRRGDVERPGPRLGDADQLARRRERAHRSDDRRRHRVEHEGDALALGGELVRQLRGHRDRHEVRRPELAEHVAHDRRQRAPVAHDVVRAQHRAPRVAVPPHRLRVDAADVEADHAGHPRRFPAMRVIPVIDLKRGVAVHAVRGERERYRPLQSTLAEGSDPVVVTRAVRDRFGLDELYVADLDAIAGDAGSPDLVAALAREALVMVDAGAADAAAVAALLELGVARVVIGTESLPGVDAFRRLRTALPDAPLVISLDLRGGRVLSPDPALAGASPAGALARLAAAGADGAIVLDLARVGSAAGPDAGLVADLRARVPGVALLAGGGVRHAGDLRALAGAGAVGALVATALHGGAIAPEELG